MRNQEEVYKRYIKPFELVEELGLNCGYEKSFKLIEHHLLRNRYLLGIEKSSLEHQQLTSICEQMEMPERFLHKLLKHFPDANLVLLGFEEGIEDCTYKIYLEYWDKIRMGMSGKHPSRDPVTMFQGFKWNAFNNSQAVLTDYTCYPLIEIDEIIEHIGKLGSSCGDSTIFDIAIEIVSNAAQLANQQPFIYLEASEDGNPRNSFDINLYPADISMKFIYPSLVDLFRHYAITNEELDLLYREVHSRTLGHLSAGIDRAGKDFFTVYYENPSQ